MASTFPAAIANEPPPLDVSSEEEDSEEFRSHGLKLDVPSGEPTPVSTPFKRPCNNKSPDKIKTVESNRTNEDLVLTVSPEDTNSSSEEVYADANDGEDSRIAHHTDNSDPVQVNGIGDDSTSDKVETKDLSKEENEDETPFHDDVTQQQEIGLEKATNHCDSSTRINYTNSNIPPQSLQICADTESLIEDSAADKDVVWDDEHLFETSEATKSSDQESSTGVVDTFDKQDSISNPTSPSSEDVAEDKSEEFLDFQAFELGSTVDVEGEETVKTSLDETNVGNNIAEHEPKLGATALESGLENDVEEDEDDDFGAFQSIPHPPPEPEACSIENDDDDDDFGDFAHNSVQALPKKTENGQPPTTLHIAQTSPETMEDFADFQDYSFQSCDAASSVKSPCAPSDIKLITSKIDSIIKSLFVIDSNVEGEATKPNSIDSEISTSRDSTWAKVQDFEGSHGLMFKWLSSLTGKRLLRSLNINTSNMVYHEKWGAIEVPKFAVSLAQSPLQPQSCNKLESQGKLEDAIVNNNTIISDDHNKPPSISTEAQEILRQLPDLSYMRANTLVFPQSSPSGL